MTAAKKFICRACFNWNHWHDTADGSCESPRCECPFKPVKKKEAQT